MTTSSSSSSSPSWPPVTLTINTNELINDCELMEVHPERGAGKVFVPIVQLAALLYTGEYVHARHVWRRWKPTTTTSSTSSSPDPLEEWWAVGRAMMESDPITLWQGLTHIQQHHPAPLNQYAKEVGDAYRTRILQKFARRPRLVAQGLGGGLGGLGGGQSQPPTQPYWSLLNFSSLADYEQFCQEQQQLKLHLQQQQTVAAGAASASGDTNRKLQTGKTTSLTQVVAFLESTPWNV